MRKPNYACLLIGLALPVLCLGLTGCPGNPTTDKKIQEAVKVPGLDEAVVAKDRAIKAAIEITWKSDVELIQEQLVVEDVHAGKVRINGVVSRPELKERAEKLAQSQEGVVDVISTITVDETLKDKRFTLDDSTGLNGGDSAAGDSGDE
jgi:osmotically-inducible protein OsmY